MHAPGYGLRPGMRSYRAETHTLGRALAALASQSEDMTRLAAGIDGEMKSTCGATREPLDVGIAAWPIACGARRRA